MYIRNGIYKLIGYMYNFEKKYNRSIHKINNCEEIQYYKILEICMQKAINKKYKYIKIKFDKDEFSEKRYKQIQKIFWFEIFCMQLQMRISDVNKWEEK